MLKSMKAGGADIENFRLGKNSDRDDVYQEEKRSIWHYIIGVLLTFSVISIIVLFTLVGKVNSDKNVSFGAKSYFVAIFPLTISTYICFFSTTKELRFLSSPPRLPIWQVAKLCP